MLLFKEMLVQFFLSLKRVSLTVLKLLTQEINLPTLRPMNLVRLLESWLYFTMHLVLLQLLQKQMRSYGNLTVIHSITL